jgi:hypothetical protein
MLSQKVVLDTMVAILGQTKGDEEITTKYRTSAKAAVKLWSTSRIDLVEGNSGLDIPKETDGAILDAFDVLDVFSAKMIAEIDALLDPVSTVSRVLSDDGVAKELLDLAVLSLDFLTRMNAITDDYQTISDDRISNLLLVEIIVLCFTGAILIVEIVFVVIPSVRHALEIRRHILKENKKTRGAKTTSRNALKIKGSEDQSEQA